MKFLTRSLLTIFALFFMFGCAAKQQMAPLPSFKAKQFNAADYKSKVDNFLILFDASSSMAEKGKFDIAKALVKRMNSTLPEMGQTAGLRSFGHSPKVSKNPTELFYGMEKYSSALLSKNFAKISEPGGITPLGRALDAAGSDLEGLSGNMNAVIIITDGLDMSDNVPANAKTLKDTYGASICFYPILVGGSAQGEKLFKEIAAIGGCGFFADGEPMLNSATMANYVKMVFLEKKAAPAPEPEPAPVVKKDSDKDGVYDDKDQCPGTPLGAHVNTVGCWTLDNVLFDFDKAVIKSAAYPLLDDVVTILEKNPDMNVDLHGHCDNVGTAKYNMDLSRRRAGAVKNYLIMEGISKERLAAIGFGYSKPVALNGTEVGRAMNRRVEIHPK